jgi:hypothetical protein
MRRDSSVSIRMGYGLEDRGSIPGSNKGFFYISQHPEQGPTKPTTQWLQGAVSPEVKRPRREDNQSRPSSAEVKNGGAIPSLPHTSS